jgi:hypothetical protein
MAGEDAPEDGRGGPSGPARRPGLVLAVVGLALAATLSLVASPAGALQEIAVETDCPDTAQPVRPAGRPATADCTLRLSYSSAGTGLTDPVQPGIPELTFPGLDPWLNAVASPSQIVTWGPGNAEEIVEIPVRVTVDASQRAPAFQTSQVEVRPEVVQHPRSEGELSRFSGVASASLPVVPGYVGLFEARMTPVQDQVRPQETLRYEVELTNHANGPTRFTFEVPGEGPPGFTPMVPEPVVVPGISATDQPATGNASSEGPPTWTTVFEVQTPYRNGYVDDRVSVQLRVDSAWAVDPSEEGMSATLTRTGHAQGAYLPGPGAGFAALAAVAGALVLPARARRG